MKIVLDMTNFMTRTTDVYVFNCLVLT